MSPDEYATLRLLIIGLQSEQAAAFEKVTQRLVTIEARLGAVEGRLGHVEGNARQVMADDVAEPPVLPAEYVALLERAQIMLWRALEDPEGVPTQDIEELQHDIVSLIGDGSVPAQSDGSGAMK